LKNRFPLIISRTHGQAKYITFHAKSSIKNSPLRVKLRSPASKAMSFKRIIKQLFACPFYPIGPFLQFISLDLSIKLVKLAELFENLIDLCHLQASLCQPDPASSPSTS
jgi:hypothetical protein